MLLLYGNHQKTRLWGVKEKTPPGYVRIYYVLGGQVLYESKYETRHLQRGHLYIFPTATAYNIVQDLNDNLECTFMHLDISPFTVFNIIDLEIPDFSVIWHLFNALSISIDLNDSFMITGISKLFAAFCEDRKLFTAIDRKVGKAIAYIAEHFNKQIRIENLASLSGYNSQYFIRIFKKATGLSPHQYIIKYRLKEARILLFKDLCISEVALMTGFYDVNSFSRLFRRAYQCSPTSYKIRSVKA